METPVDVLLILAQAIIATLCFTIPGLTLLLRIGQQQVHLEVQIGRSSCRQVVEKLAQPMREG